MSDQRPLQGLRTLVLEDEYFVADDLKQILRRQGADIVKLSGSVEDALASLRAESFDFALVDINIHGEMTFEVADALLERGLPFAFVTGYNRVVIPLRFEDVPNWGKPYDDRQIVDGIRGLQVARTGRSQSSDEH